MNEIKNKFGVFSVVVDDVIIANYRDLHSAQEHLKNLKVECADDSYEALLLDYRKSFIKAVKECNLCAEHKEIILRNAGVKA